MKNFLAVVLLFASLDSQAGLALLGKPENSYDAYRAQASALLQDAATRTNAGPNKIQAKSILLMPVYYSTDFMSNLPNSQGNTLAEYEPWWGGHPERGGWAHQHIVNGVFNGVADGIKSMNKLFRGSKTLKAEAAVFELGSASAEDNDFMFNVQNVPNASGEGPYAYTSFKNPYFKPSLGRQVAAGTKVDAAMFVKFQAFWDKRKASISQTNGELYLNYEVYLAVETYLCNAEACSQATISGREPVKMIVPVPNLNEVTSKENRNANSVFSEKLTSEAITAVVMSQLKSILE